MPFLFLIVAIFFSPFVAFAAATVSAQISLIVGQVETRVAPASAAKKASVGQKIQANAAIITHDKSLAMITIPDGSRIKVGPNSEVILTEILAAHGTTPSSTVVSLVVGSLFSKVRKQEAGAKFQVRTKSASMGVRGTEFFAAFSQKKSGEPDLWMCVHEGKVFVQDTADTKSVLVKEGEGVLIPAGKAVTDPKPYAWTKNLNWNMDTTKGELMDTTSLDSAYKDLLDQNYD